MAPLLQVELRGTAFGSGTPFIWDQPGPNLFGWDSLRTTDENNPQESGYTSGAPDLLGTGSKKLILPFQIAVASDTEALHLAEVLATAFAPAGTDLQMTVRTHAWERTVRGRPRRVAVKESLALREDVGYLTAVAQFEMSDPYFFDPTVNLVGALGITIGGRSYPYSYPYSYGSSTPGTIHVTTSGNAPAKPVLLLVAGSDGVIDPIFEIVETGERLRFAGLVMAPGDLLFVDFRNRSAIAGPDLALGANVLGFIDRVTSDWWTGAGVLPAGDSNIFATAGAGTGTLFLAFNPAWLL